MPALTAAVDCGTTSVKAGVFDLAGRVLAGARRPAPCERHPDGRVEIDPAALAAAALGVLADAVREACSRGPATPADVLAVAVTSQRATFLRLDSRGDPLGPAVCWQDGRGGAEARALAGRIAPARFREVTGLPLNPVFTVAKLMAVAGAPGGGWSRAATVALVTDWIARSLGVAEAVTDASSASLTGLLDVTARRWSDEVLQAAGLDGTAAALPAVVAPGTPIGRVSATAAAATGLLHGTPIVAGGGDQQCAGLGAGAVRAGVVEVALGTAGVPLVWSDRPRQDAAAGLMCCCHALPDAWEVEGFQNSAGSALAWISGCAQLPLHDPDGTTARLESAPPGADGVVFYPYLCGGSSAPHWNPAATGAFLGLRDRHGPECMARAVVEGVSLETRRIVESLAASGLVAAEVRTTGGGAVVGAWNRILADVLGVPVAVPSHPDAALVGAAMLAASGAGAHPSVAAACAAMARVERRLDPDPDRHALYDDLYGRYRDVQEVLERHGVFSRVGQSARTARWG